MAFRVLPPHHAEYFGLVDLDCNGSPGGSRKDTRRERQPSGLELSPGKLGRSRSRAARIAASWGFQPVRTGSQFTAVKWLTSGAIVLILFTPRAAITWDLTMAESRI